MKPNRTHLFIAASSLALLIVLIIQVNWILEAAKMKEELFNEKATMVLSKTAEALASDTSTRKKIAVRLGNNEVHKIDSIFRYYMNIYNIHINYYFDVKPGSVKIKNDPVPSGNYGFKPACYQACVPAAAASNGLNLKLVFPDKEEFILAEMGVPFFTSVSLIIVVLVMSWRTILSLLNEKKISEHTTDFLNNMTHEFKTPLTNIALAAKMIGKDSNIRQEEKIRHYSGIILEENEKLRLQVEQVLSMTALERGEIPLQKAEFDFHQLIHDSLKCMNLQIENTQGNIQLNLEANRFMVYGDKTHFTNAICNLIDNAIKYADKDPALVIHTSNNEQNLIIQISDNGIGIAQQYHKKVFEKFFRVPTGNVHNVKGFGLGLAYVKAIVELHFGTIELLSEKEKGTTFIITLPHA